MVKLYKDNDESDHDERFQDIHRVLTNVLAAGKSVTLDNLAVTPEHLYDSPQLVSIVGALLFASRKSLGLSQEDCAALERHFQEAEPS